MTMAWHMAVLVPARDESILLPRCLWSIQRARRAMPSSVSTDVIVVVDSSRDGTHVVAEQILGPAGLVVQAELGAVGPARALAADLALRRLPETAGACWLANTDADCVVPEDWLLRQLLAAQSGVAATAGIVDVDSFAEHGREVEMRFRMSYALHADGTHPHVHGANLGVRADAYLQAGGWSDLSTAEDHDLWRRLGSRGYRCAADSALQVVTSGRRKGRAPFGFAQALAAHNGPNAS